MITAEKVKATIVAILVAEFPDSEVHVDLLPVNFIRPAFYVEQYEIATRDVNKTTIEEVCKTAVTCLVNLDEYSNSADNDLALVSERVRELLRDGVIYIEDRAVRCTVLAKKDAELARLEITTTHWETRREIVPQSPMKDINISQKESR